MRALWMIGSFAALLGCESTSNGGTCSPVGFTTCSGNDMVTCVAAGDSGMTMRRDCTAEGLVCARGTSDGVCTQATALQACYVQNWRTCTAASEIVRCVWVSEQPAPGLSGDIGAWRVESTCSGGQVCQPNAGNPACASP